MGRHHHVVEGQAMPPHRGPIWLVGFGALAPGFALRQLKRVHSISLKKRVLSVAFLALACLSGFFGFLFCVALWASGGFDSVVPWILLGVAVLLVVVVPLAMLKLGARYCSVAEIEETIRKNPYARLTTPEDVASALVALALPATYWLTGNVLYVDGAEAHCE
jgi:fatty acid desaturase